MDGHGVISVAVWQTLLNWSTSTAAEPPPGTTKCNKQWPTTLTTARWLLEYRRSFIHLVSQSCDISFSFGPNKDLTMQFTEHIVTWADDDDVDDHASNDEKLQDPGSWQWRLRQNKTKTKTMMRRIEFLGITQLTCFYT